MDMISRILKNDLYIGNLRTHKKELSGIRGKAREVSKAEQYVFEKHHEAIISTEQFDKVQKILEKRYKETSSYRKGVNEYIFRRIYKMW